jgi:hypothetical protein
VVIVRKEGETLQAEISHSNFLLRERVPIPADDADTLSAIPIESGGVGFGSFLLDELLYFNRSLSMVELDGSSLANR